MTNKSQENTATSLPSYRKNLETRAPDASIQKGSKKKQGMRQNTKAFIAVQDIGNHSNRALLSGGI